MNFAVRASGFPTPQKSVKYIDDLSDNIHFDIMNIYRELFLMTAE